MKAELDDKKTGQVANSAYRAPWWLPGGHLQTIYAHFLKRETDLCLRRERWETPDSDFIDLDWLDSSEDSANLIVLFMGWKAVRAVTMQGV
jgi:uncharacterized protein